MRIQTLAMFALGACVATVSASGQTYGNTDYPVCLQVFGRFDHIDCSYVSIEQCRPSATARAAQCITNPYYAPPRGAARGRYHRHHHAR